MNAGADVKVVESADVSRPFLVAGVQTWKLRSSGAVEIGDVAVRAERTTARTKPRDFIESVPT